MRTNRVSRYRLVLGKQAPVYLARARIGYAKPGLGREGQWEMGCHGLGERKRVQTVQLVYGQYIGEMHHQGGLLHLRRL